MRTSFGQELDDSMSMVRLRGMSFVFKKGVGNRKNGVVGEVIANHPQLGKL